MEHAESIGQLISQISPVQVLKKEEQALTEYQPSKTGNLLPALQEDRICNLLDPDNELLRGVLRYCMILVGIRANNLPEEIEKKVLIQFIKDHYSGHTISEIRLAFDMAVSGRLDIDDVNCYENFSPVYFGKILNAYRKWSSQQYVQEVKEEFVQTNYSESELLDMQRMRAAQFYQRIRSGIQEKIPDDVRDVLVKDGRIKEMDDAAEYFVRLLNGGVAAIYYEPIP